VLSYQIDNIIEIIRWLVFIAAGSGGVTLILRTWFKARGQLAAEQVRELLDSVESLHEAVDDLRAQQSAFHRQMQERVGEISGRVEFAERMLGKGET
jgi:predicted phage tail protein